MKTVNNHLIVSVYDRSSGMQTKVEKGFASVQQSNSIKGLILLSEARLADGTDLPAGSVVYFEEKWLYSDGALKGRRTLNGQDVMLLPFTQVLGYEIPKKD